MKKLFVITCVLFMAVLSFAQQGRVHQYLGKSVFWHNTPVAEYEVAFTFRSETNPAQRQASQSEDIVKQALITAGKNDFDAIIVTTTDYDIAIKFKNSGDDKTLCLAAKINNIPFLIDADPIQQYTIIKKKKVYRVGSMKYLTSREIAELLLNKKAKCDMLLIGDDQVHLYIKFL